MAVVRGGQILGNVASASFALSASYINPTFISQSAAAAGFGSGGGVTIGGGSFISTGNVSASVSPSGDIFIVKSGSYNPFTVSETGLVTVSGSATNLFLIKNTNNQPVLTVSQSGVIVLATQSVQLTSAAPNGGIYFTSGGFFVGLE